MEQLFVKQDGQVLLRIPNDTRKCRSLGFIIGDTFYSKKTAKHLLRIRNALGICYALITNYNFKFIEINYCGKILKTTREYFLRQGEMYRFGDFELQIFLPLQKFGMDKVEEWEEKRKNIQKGSQNELFKGAVK